MYYFSAGGLFGDVISSALLPQFNFVGTTVLLLSFFATGFTLASGISWLSVVDLIGASTLWAGKKAIALPQGVGQLSLPSAKLLSAQKDTDNSDDISISTLRPTEPAADDRPFNIKHETLYKVPEDILDDEPEVLINVDTMSSDISLGAITPEITMDYDTPAQAEPVMDAAVVSSPLVKSVMKHKHVEKPEGERPSFALLDRADKVKNPITKEELEGISRLVEEKLADFNISAQVVGVYPGPVITRFELDLAPGVKVSKITTLSKDLARAMSAISVRVVEVIPGKSVIGLELPNKNRDMVRLSEVIEGESFQSASSPLTMVLGADISGKPVVVDLAKMPHLLVAGTTGSGKSVGVNVMILSLLYKSSPEDVRMIMIDPKMLELSVYEGIPHLLAEVVTDMKEAANALRWCVGEMERRYRLMSALGVRNLKGYNAKVLKAIADGQPIKDPLWQQGDSMDAQAPDLTKLPAIVVVVDEFADMMMIVGKKVEELIARIAQKARAAGIHLILATQRPSVDVITGLIKANIPTRIAFQVSSKIDSRTILDQQGAEALLGMGDMLYLPPGTGVPTRVHGAFVDDHEVHAVVGDWKKRGEPEYIDEILNPEIGGEVLLPGEQAENADQEMDVFYDEAVAFVTETRKASVSSVQRKFRIGYNRAARLVDQMEQSGIVSAPGHNGNREVLAAAAPRD
jgi:S-DNA-T family DNA segregation ATPase FtsK/SpoIIIE